MRVCPTASFPHRSLASVVSRFTLAIDGCLIHASASFSVIPMLHTESVDGWPAQVGAGYAFVGMQNRDQWTTTTADARSNK
jgi:hypothetical protein